MTGVLSLQSTMYGQRVLGGSGPVPNTAYRTIGDTDTDTTRGSVFNPWLLAWQNAVDRDRESDDDRVEDIIDDLLEDDERDDDMSLGDRLRQSAIDATKKEVCMQLQSYDQEAGMPYANFDYSMIDFRDIKSSRYRGAVIELSQYCLVHGYFNTGFYFGVKENLTVGEAYKILVRVVMNDEFVTYGAIVDTAHWAQPYALATRDEWEDIQSRYDSLDEDISLRDYMKLIVMIMDKYMPRDYEVNFDVVASSRVLTRGEAAAMTQTMIEKLYQYEESPFADFEYDGDRVSWHTLPSIDSDEDIDDEDLGDIGDLLDSLLGE